jgi:hypothetical protein
MDGENDGWTYLSAGTIAAILLGMALVPFRDFTTASNFTFPFLALTIAVAEFGGPRAAVATALASALSLDFFLTKPYLRLTIEGKHDIIAFLGLTACGLVAAVLASSRRRSRADRHLDLLHRTLSETEGAGPVGPALSKALDAVRDAFPFLSAAVVRDEHGEIVARFGGAGAPTAPAVLRFDTLLSLGGPPQAVPRRGLPLPKQGGRLELRAGNRRVGWLDVWGNEESASAEARRTLSDVGRIVGTLLARGAHPATGLA